MKSEKWPSRERAERQAPSKPELGASLSLYTLLMAKQRVLVSRRKLRESLRLLHAVPESEDVLTCLQDQIRIFASKLVEDTAKKRKQIFERTKPAEEISKPNSAMQYLEVKTSCNKRRRLSRTKIRESDANAALADTNYSFCDLKGVALTKSLNINNIPHPFVSGADYSDSHGNTPGVNSYFLQ